MYGTSDRRSGSNQNLVDEPISAPCLFVTQSGTRSLARIVPRKGKVTLPTDMLFIRNNK
jgi:hypothetical protein